MTVKVIVTRTKVFGIGLDWIVYLTIRFSGATVHPNFFSAVFLDPATVP